MAVKWNPHAMHWIEQAKQNKLSKCCARLYVIMVLHVGAGMPTLTPAIVLAEVSPAHRSVKLDAPKEKLATPTFPEFLGRIFCHLAPGERA